MKRLIALAALLYLAACTTPESPAQAVYLAESDYAAALRIELAYSELPRCGKPSSPTLCSEVSVIRKVQKADDLAWIAIQEAQGAVRTKGFSESRIKAAAASAVGLTKAFVRITNELKVK